MSYISCAAKTKTRYFFLSVNLIKIVVSPSFCILYAKKVIQVICICICIVELLLKESHDFIHTHTQIKTKKLNKK